MIRERLRERLLDILRRHIRLDDSQVSDDDFVRRVMRRYEAARGDYLIDPNE
jgi:hypothetical protein